MQPAASGITSPSAYTIENTTEPGNKQNRIAARTPMRGPHQSVASRCTRTAATRPPIPATMTPAAVMAEIDEYMAGRRGRASTHITSGYPGKKPSVE
jgi:hypothetical protein